MWKRWCLMNFLVLMNLKLLLLSRLMRRKGKSWGKGNRQIVKNKDEGATQEVATVWLICWVVGKGEGRGWRKWRWLTLFGWCKWKWTGKDNWDWKLDNSQTFKLFFKVKLTCHVHVVRKANRNILQRWSGHQALGSHLQQKIFFQKFLKSLLGQWVDSCQTHGRWLLKSTNEK